MVYRCLAPRRSGALVLPLRPVQRTDTAVSNASAASPTRPPSSPALRRGVVMWGRQATGNYIASRDVRKIEAADRSRPSPFPGRRARYRVHRMAQLSFDTTRNDRHALSSSKRTTSANHSTKQSLFALLVLPLLAGWDGALQVGESSNTTAPGLYERFDFSTIGSELPSPKNLATRL